MNSRRAAILRSTAVYQKFHVCRPLKEKFCFIYIIIRHVCFIRAKSTSSGALNEKGPQLYESVSSVDRSQAMSSD